MMFNGKRAVLKYRLSGPDNSFVVPGSAVPLSVAFQRGHLHVWADVTQGSPGRLCVSVRGTGQELGDGDLGQFVGTVLLEEGGLILHVWARFEVEATATGDESGGEVVS